jgi:mRNA interferase HigB
MHIIKRARLVEFWTKHPEAKGPLQMWYRIVRMSRWRHVADLKRGFPSADLVGRLTVFNIGGNKFRLIAYIDYMYRKVFVRSILAHADYTKAQWKNDPWF